LEAGATDGGDRVGNPLLMANKEIRGRRVRERSIKLSWLG